MYKAANMKKRLKVRLIEHVHVLTVRLFGFGRPAYGE
jgi:hypothetical protein